MEDVLIFCDNCKANLVVEVEYTEGEWSRGDEKRLIRAARDAGWTAAVAAERDDYSARCPDHVAVPA